MHNEQITTDVYDVHKIGISAICVYKQTNVCMQLCVYVRLCVCPYIYIYI